MNTPNNRILLHAREDLAWLAEEFTNFDGTEQELRHASPIVRRLLLDAGLQQARKLAIATGQPTLEHFPLTKYAPTPADFANIDVALGMGFRLGTRKFGPVIMTTNPQDDENPQSEPHQMVREHLSLGGYMNSTCAVFRGHQISRRHLIKYIANSDGGAHHGTKDKSTQYVQAIENAPLSRVGQLRPVYSEFLATIQALTSSPTVMEPFGLHPAPSPLFDHPTGGVTNHVFEQPARSWLAFDLGTT